MFPFSCGVSIALPACRHALGGARHAAIARFSKNGWLQLLKLGSPSHGETVMFDHIGLHVRDIEASRRFYAAVLAPLGHVLDSSGTGFGPKDTPALWLYEARKTAAEGAHVACHANDDAIPARCNRRSTALALGGDDRRLTLWRRT